MKYLKKKELAQKWFRSLRNEVINQFEKIENQNSKKQIKFKKKIGKENHILKKIMVVVKWQ